MCNFSEQKPVYDFSELAQCMISQNRLSVGLLRISVQFLRMAEKVYQLDDPVYDFYIVVCISSCLVPLTEVRLPCVPEFYP